MIQRRFLTTAVIICFAIFVNACGSDAHGAYSSNNEVVPTTVGNLAGNAGVGAVSLGWDAPDTGTQPLSYNITISPTATNATITSSATHALIQGLTNDTTYTFSVTAKNNAGESSASTILLKPTAIDTNSFSSIDQDPNAIAGISDPSFLNVAESNTLWMAYSRINAPSAGSFAQSTGLAYSNDGGATLTYVTAAINQTNVATITPRTINPCGGNSTCSGRWVYEMPFLVDDKTDDASKRFKLFALKYFVYLPSSRDSDSATFFALGAIVMKTGASPDSISSSSESVVLSWDSTPQELSATNNIKNIDANLNECTALIEGSATTYQDALDFVFACPNSNDTQKIVLLRSTDHAKTFKYISTPLTAADATSYNANALYFSAPSLLPTESSAPVLMATPVTNRVINGSTATQTAYSGCAVFPFADEETGTLFRSNSSPLSILDIQAVTSHTNGACAWDRGAVTSGILMNDYDPSASVPFGISNTAKRL